MKKPYRKIFHFSSAEKEWLAQLARTAEISEAQVVRDLVLFAAQRAGLPDPRRSVISSEPVATGQERLTPI